MQGADMALAPFANFSHCFPFYLESSAKCQRMSGMHVLQAHWFRYLLNFYPWIFFSSNVWEGRHYDSLPNGHLFFLFSSASKPVIHSLLPGSQVCLWVLRNAVCATWSHAPKTWGHQQGSRETWRRVKNLMGPLHSGPLPPTIPHPLSVSSSILIGPLHCEISPSQCQSVWPTHSFQIELNRHLSYLSLYRHLICCGLASIALRWDLGVWGALLSCLLALHIRLQFKPALHTALSLRRWHSPS